MSIEWFRWHHGTVCDPKLALIAKRSGQPRPFVIAVWAALLEHASQSDDRGSVDDFDSETLAVALDIDEEDILAILAAMSAKQMIVNGRIVAWESRQPQREDGSAERAKAWREKQKQQNLNARERTRTHANALEQKRPTEEIREDQIREEEEENARAIKKRADEPEPTVIPPPRSEWVSVSEHTAPATEPKPKPELASAIVDAWNEIRPQFTINLPPRRRRAIESAVAFVAEQCGKPDWPESTSDITPWFSDLFRYVNDHPGYLRDRDFDFFLAPDRICKTVEGGYEPRH